MSTSVHIPLEIIEEILCRLPAKSVGRFRCVSKPWKALTSKPQFIEAHLNRSSERIIGLCSDLTYYTVDAVFAAEAAAEPIFLSLDICSYRFIGLCNGLILANGMGDSFNLINPTTRDYARIANIGPPEDPLPDWPTFDFWQKVWGGLGYDSKNDDYKVVEISSRDFRMSRDTIFTVYSLRNRNSRGVVKPPKGYDKFIPRTGFYLNGRLHWLCYRRSYSSWFIAALNLTNEEFEELDLPSSLRDRFPHILVAVNGFLCLCVRYDNVTDVWVMKDYGMRESWKKIPIHGLGMSSVIPLCFIMGDQEVVLEVDLRRVIVYNVEERTSRDVDLKARGLPRWFTVQGTYVESLVSPKRAIGLRKDREGSEYS